MDTRGEQVFRWPRASAGLSPGATHSADWVSEAAGLLPEVAACPACGLELCPAGAGRL